MTKNPESLVLNDLRNFPRFRVNSQIPFLAKFENADQVPIVEISHGGFSVGSQLKVAVAVGEKRPITLQILDTKVDGEVRVIHKTASGYGLSFQKRHVEALRFLQRLIKRVQQGASLIEVDKEHLKDEYKAPSWSYFRGDNATDLFMHFKGQELDEMHLLIPDGDIYREIKFKGKQISTLQTEATDQGTAVGAMSKPDSKPNKDSVRLSLFVILGINHPKLMGKLTPYIKAALALV